MIEVRNLEKSFGNLQVLRGISEIIKEQEVVCVIGPSGSGKSTFLRCLNLLEEPTGGEVFLDGEKINTPDADIDKIRERLGMVFQNFNLFPHMTVLDNITRAPIKVRKTPKDEAEAAARKILETVGLSDKENSYPSSLSGGQKQRVAIARALTMDPKILLCDEATSALDPKTTSSILDLLMEINGETGITIVIVTHQMEVVRKACRKACILERGVIKSMGDVLDIFYRRPASLLRLLGEDQASLPDEGVNLRVAYDAEGPGASFFESFSKEAGFVPEVVDGGIQNFRNRATGLFTLNVREEDLGRAGDFLDRAALKWDRIDEEWIAESTRGDEEEE